MQVMEEAKHFIVMRALVRRLDKTFPQRVFVVFLFGFHVAQTAPNRGHDGQAKLQKRGHISLAQHPLVLQQTEAWAQFSKLSPRRAALPRLRAAIDKLRNQGYFEDLVTRYGALPPSRAVVNSRM